MLIDTHAHLNFKAFEKDADEVIRRSLDNDIWMINVGSQFATSKKAVELAEKYPQGVYASIGLHPIHVSSGVLKVKTDSEETEEKEEVFDISFYRQLAVSSKKVVAIGEIGLDYYYRPKTKTRLEVFKNHQKEVFLEQINLAEELNLPMILHCRFGHEDLIEILSSKFQVSGFKINGVVHCFTGTLEQAKQYLAMGFYLGFNGIIFKLDLGEVISKTPLEKILVETDCPYLTPPIAEKDFSDSTVFSGGRRNEPFFVKYVLERISRLKNISFEEAADITAENARKLFRF